ncbi:hypothetical protein D3C81_1581570 [compost metagenome]
MLQLSTLKATFLSKKELMNQKLKQHKAEQTQLLLRQQAPKQPQHLQLQQLLIVRFWQLQVFVNLLANKASTLLK